MKCSVHGEYFEELCTECQEKNERVSGTPEFDGSMRECYKHFCEFHLDGKDLYPTFTKWLFCHDEKCVSFRQGWSVAHNRMKSNENGDSCGK